MIEVGDTVKIIRAGKIYSTYDEFFEEFEPNLLERYQLRFTAKNNFVGNVIFKHNHMWEHQGILCVVEDKNKNIVLIGEDGLKKIEFKEIAEITKLLFKSKSRETSDEILKDVSREEIIEILLGIISMEQVNNALFGQAMNTELPRGIRSTTSILDECTVNGELTLLTGKQTRNMRTMK
jgi:hypothetical protein